MNEIAWVNGVWSPLAEATTSIHDRAFAFGDAIDDVVAGYGERLWCAERHWRRLERSLGELGIEGVDIPALIAVVDEMVARAEAENPLVYVQVSRGIAIRTHGWDPDTIEPSVMITVREAPYPTADMLVDGVPCITQPDLRWRRCDIKTLNLLPNVMAKQKAKQAGCYEAILIDGEIVTEGCSTSVCIVRDDAILAHPNGPRILPGVTRGLVLELAAGLGIPINETPFDRATMLSADEVFLTGTATEVLGVTRIDDQKVANGFVGPTTKRLEVAYRKAIAAGADAPRD